MAESTSVPPNSPSTRRRSCGAHGLEAREGAVDMSLLGLEIWVGHLGSLLCPLGGSVQPSIVTKLRQFVKTHAGRTLA